MWINKNLANPSKEGKYKCLVDADGFGNLIEAENQLFNGNDWDLYESNCQFISYWWATKEEYNTVSNKIDKDLE